MKLIFCSLLAVLLLVQCSKPKTSPTDPLSDFTKYTIYKGQQYCDGNTFKITSISSLAFQVKFDSSAIYQSVDRENQYDINKLYGFSDNNAQHQQYSARFGWNWSDGALHIHAYTYNAGAVAYKEITAVPIGAIINYSIDVTASEYIFTVNGITQKMPRLSTTAKAAGYQLYPYFGGDETAPHDVRIWIKETKKI